MNLHHLKLFVAIAETGSFSRAAEQMSLTQSTVSQHLAHLERDVEARLLDRTSKGAVPTAAGKLFLRHARRVLGEQETLLQAMAGFRGLQQAELLIGASNIPANYLVPELLRPLAEEHPGITLSMRTGDSREVLELLLTAEIELAVIGNRFSEKGVRYQPLIKEQLHLVIGQQHAWSGRETISLEELTSEPILLRETGSGSGDALHKALQSAGCSSDRLKIAGRLGSNEAVRQAVMLGVGCAFLSGLSIRRELETGELRALSVAGLNVERQLWLATLRDRALSPAAEIFCTLLQNHGEIFTRKLSPANQR